MNLEIPIYEVFLFGSYLNDSFTKRNLWKGFSDKELVAVSNPNLMEQLTGTIPEAKFLFLVILFLVITSGLMITFRKMRVKHIIQAKDWQSLQSSLDVNAYE